MQITGIKEIIRELDRLEQDIVAAVTRGVQKTAKAVLKDAQHRASHPFQEFASYLHGIRGGGSRKYPKGTPPAFANRGERLGNLNLAVGEYETETLPVQYGPGTKHPLYEGLGIDDAKLVADAVEAGVGYAENVPNFVWKVMFGTPRMVARPFLEVALEDAGRGGLESTLARNVADEVTAVLGGK